MQERINTNLRFYLPSDPLYYEVMNIPIKGLLANEEVLQFRIDQLQAQLDSISGRETFGDLRPYTSEATPGKVFVREGNFIARLNIPSDRYTGLGERLNSGENESTERGKIKAQPEDSLYGLNKPDKAGGIARTALVRILKTNGVDPSVSVPSFTAEDYPAGDNASNKTPVYRLDIVYAEGYPAEDQDNARPKIGIIKGGYFLDYPESISEGRKSGNRFETQDQNLGGTVHQQSKDILESDVISDKKDSDKFRYTTVPSIEDLKNFEWRSVSGLVNDPSNNFLDTDFDIPSISQLTEWAHKQLDNRGTFCLPVAYVLVPFGHIEGNHIPLDNLMDIRPFFRTAEMTFDERQAIAASFKPTIQNRFLTRKDPDYTTLRNKLVKGAGEVGPGNHEGRISKLENDLPIGSYIFDRAGSIFLINSEYGGQTTEFTYRGTSDLDIEVEIPLTIFTNTVDTSKIRGLIVRLDTYLKAGGSNNSSVRLITKVTKPSLNVKYEVADQSAFVVGRQTAIVFIPTDSDGENLLFNATFQIQGLPTSADPVQCRAYVTGVFY